MISVRNFLSTKNMRDAFIKTLEKKASKNKNIFFITGDLGYSVIENYQAKFPNQFLNAGIAEQNMTGIAAGLASTGKSVFTYSIANFPILRALEQIRNNICYHNLNVKIISVGAGFHYGILASTHHATEDLAIMRALPNMVVLAPADPVETKLATEAMIKYNGPCYMRIGKSPIIHKTNPNFKIGKAIVIQQGNDITLVSTGGMLSQTMEIAKLLKKENVNAKVISMHTIKPLDINIIKNATKETKAIFTIEEHSIIGGLGSAVAEVIAENNINTKFKRIGVDDTFSKYIGDQEFLKEKHGLSNKDIIKTIKKLM